MNRFSFGWPTQTTANVSRLVYSKDFFDTQHHASTPTNGKKNCFEPEWTKQNETDICIKLMDIVRANGHNRPDLKRREETKQNKIMFKKKEGEKLQTHSLD